MSNLLNEAIVDAKALREAALRNAEAAVVDKYSQEVQNTLEKLLEQDEELGLDLGADLEDPAGEDLAMETEDVPQDDVGEDVPYSAANDLDGENSSGLKGAPVSGDPVQLTIDVDALQEAVRELEEAIEDNDEFEVSEEQLISLITSELSEAAELVDADTAGEASAAESEAEDDEFEGSGEGGEGPVSEKKGDKGPYASGARSKAGVDDDGDGVPDGADKDKDDPEIQEEDIDFLVDEIVEKLTVDMGATLSGWAGRSSESQKYEMEREMAHRRSTDVEEEMQTLKKAYEELVFENKQLNKSLKNHKQVVSRLEGTLQEVNLSNARLLYTNRVLGNASLNERQKTKIADAISQAGSVTEAKTIYQTLESAVPAAPKRSTQSLSEAIRRPSTSVIRASRKESTSSDPFTDRMKKLAGID
jgi:hypothetical protein